MQPAWCFNAEADGKKYASEYSRKRTYPESVFRWSAVAIDKM